VHGCSGLNRTLELPAGQSTQRRSDEEVGLAAWYCVAPHGPRTATHDVWHKKMREMSHLSRGESEGDVLNTVPTQAVGGGRGGEIYELARAAHKTAKSSKHA
jgi:hypothetical protein